MGSLRSCCFQMLVLLEWSRKAEYLWQILFILDLERRGLFVLGETLYIH